MKAIVTLLPKPKSFFLFLRLVVSPKVTCKKTAAGTEPVMVYACNPLWKWRFSSILAKIQKNHSFVVLDAAWKKYPHLYQELSIREVFLKNLDRILACFCGGGFLRPAIFSQSASEKILPLLECFSRHARVVTLCTEDTLWFETISQKALLEWGLSLNLRSPDNIGEIDLMVLLSPLPSGILPHCPVINLADCHNPPEVNCLTDFTDEASEEFFCKNPHLQFRHCHLVQKNSPLKNLIWKIQKKS